jgi:hypothetical protein
MSLRRSSGTLKPQFNPFKEDYLAEIFTAIAIAWANMSSPKRNEIEDRITFRLAGWLANDPQFEDSPYDFVAQYWLLGLRGQALGRLDLRIKHRYSQRDYFAFEAKRLHVTYPSGKLSTEYATYSGEDGMMAFVKGQYCKGLPCAGMLGYVMDNESTRAWTGLRNRIDSKRRQLRLTKGSQLGKSELSYCISNSKQGTLLGETTHELTRRRLRLFHLFLPV